MRPAPTARELERTKELLQRIKKDTSELYVLIGFCPCRKVVYEELAKSNTIKQAMAMTGKVLESLYVADARLETLKETVWITEPQYYVVHVPRGELLSMDRFIHADSPTRSLATAQKMAERQIRTLQRRKASRPARIQRFTKDYDVLIIQYDLETDRFSEVERKEVEDQTDTCD